MHKFILLFILLIGEFNNVTAQTKKETIDWLNGKFGGTQEMIYESEVISYARFLKINDDGSFVIIHREIWHNLNGTNKMYVTTFHGNFKDMSPNSFRIEKVNKNEAATLMSRNNTFLYLDCRSGNCITQVDYKEGTSPVDKQVTEIHENNSVTIAVITENDDQSLIERSKKAFIHLIMLCGGKKEAY